jgi:hypothetical protein
VDGGGQRPGGRGVQATEGQAITTGSAAAFWRPAYSHWSGAVPTHADFDEPLGDAFLLP